MAQARETLLRETLPRETLPGLLDGVAAARPAAPALIHGDRCWSYGEVADLTRRMASGLAERGLRHGDRIALWLPTIPDYLLLSFAAWRLGAVVVSANTRFQASELAHLLGGTRPRMLAYWPGFTRADFPAILAAVPPDRLASIETVLVPEGEGSAAGLGRRPVATSAALAEAPPLAADLATPDDPCVIFTTSGTTKAPKFVLHRHGGMARHGREVAQALGFDAPDAATLQALPLCAVFGFAQAMGAIAGGGPQIMLAAFEASEAAALIRHHQITHCCGTDEMLGRLLDVSVEAQPFPSLRCCPFVIFNPARSNFLEAAERRGLPLRGVYGMSEVSALFAVRREDDPPAERIRNGGRLTSPDAAVRIRDPETGALLPPGRSGMIELLGPSVMSEYDGNPEATREAFTEDGFLRTGDIGQLASERVFIYESRTGDVLRLGGFLVSPAEIEHYLERHPDLAGVQVVGALTSDRPCAVAFVLLRPGSALDEAALRRYCAEGLAKYKVPERIVALDAFPVTLSGNGTKIQRHKLRSLAQALFG